MKPLSVGNVVSAGLRIYRDNFAKYFGLALLGNLWLFAPIAILATTGTIIGLVTAGSVLLGDQTGLLGISVLLIVAAIVGLIYSSARYAAMSGLIARLAYGEVAEQPETITEARRYIKPKMWSFWLAGILLSLIFLGAAIGYSITLGIAALAAGLVAGQNSDLAGIMRVIILIVGVLLFIIGGIWLSSRLFLTELPLAVEDNTTPGVAISRSWELTKGGIGRIQLVLLVAFLVSIPLSIATNIVAAIVRLVISATVQSLPPTLAIAVSVTIYVALMFAGQALLIPFWQSIRAVIYHDLRVRREGIGLNLRK